MNKFSDMAKALGHRGGKKSAKVRFKDLTPEEITEMMRKVRLTPKDKEELKKMADAELEALRSIK